MTSLDFSTILPEVVLAAYALIALLGNGSDVIAHRAGFTESYQRYLDERQAIEPEIVRNAR